MTGFHAWHEFAMTAEIHGAIEECRRNHIVALGQSNSGTRRSLVRSGFALAAAGTTWHSLWLLTHRPLRRAGVRRHPTSAAALLAWRGRGLVLWRGPAERRSIELAPIETTDPEAVRYVQLPAGTHYDTLADETPWHLLVFHSAPAAGLVREDETPEGWIERSEEVDS